MLIGSHNSWSYAKPKRWYMRPFRFTTKCQDYDIRTLYEKCNVRCFDLRVRFNKDNKIIIAHGLMEYNISELQLFDDLEYINNKKDCYVRVLFEVRNKKSYTLKGREAFKRFCNNVVCKYNYIKFWCGKNLYNWETEYLFEYNPSCEEKYSSVCKPKLIDDWFPRLYTLFRNKHLTTDKEILLIDFVTSVV